MIEKPIEKAKRLLKNDEVLVSSVGWRQLVSDLLLEIEARELAIADACLGEYGDISLINHVKDLTERNKEKLNAREKEAA